MHQSMESVSSSPSTPKLVEQKKILLGAYGFSGNECNGVVEKPIRPDSGGIYLKLAGCNYLWKGDPKLHVHSAITASKKIFTVLSAVMSDRMTQFLFAFLFVFRRKFLLKLCREVLDLIYRPFFVYRLKPEKYCVSVRELRRAIEAVKIPDEFQEDVNKTRDVVAMNLETDVAYRFPFQDILPKIDKERFRENPAKEIKRVSDIFVERGSIEDNWRKFEKLLVLLMRFSKKARNLAIEFISELDMDKIKLDEADWFFCLNRPNYKFRGVSKEERLKIRDEIYEREGKPETINIKEHEK